MRHSVDFDGIDTKNFVANSRRGEQYASTIQNNTSQTLTVTVTNEDIFGTSPTFVAPASGILTITTGGMASLNEPYSGWKLTLPLVGSAGESIDIYEAG